MLRPWRHDWVAEAPGQLQWFKSVSTSSARPPNHPSCCSYSINQYDRNYFRTSSEDITSVVWSQQRNMTIILLQLWPITGGHCETLILVKKKKKCWEAASSRGSTVLAVTRQGQLRHSLAVGAWFPSADVTPRPTHYIQVFVALRGRRACLHPSNRLTGDGLMTKWCHVGISSKLSYFFSLAALHYSYSYSFSEI